MELDGLLTTLVGAIGAELRTAGVEIGHLKAIGMHGGSFAVANLVSSRLDPELSRASHATTDALHLVLNAQRGVRSGIAAAHSRFRLATPRPSNTTARSTSSASNVFAQETVLTRAVMRKREFSAADRSF
ncbi:MAG: hypothetical protein QM775_11170 [Pirellulales bacterium]